MILRNIASEVSSVGDTDNSSLRRAELILPSLFPYSEILGEFSGYAAFRLSFTCHLNFHLSVNSKVLFLEFLSESILGPNNSSN